MSGLGRAQRRRARPDSPHRHPAGAALHETGELVEYATYQAYGATESNYRPERWGSFREAYKFTGKEEDVEVGLAYFGARYLSLGLGTWMSPDPVTIHQLGSDFNPYAYVHGQPLNAIDPDGRAAVGAAILVAAVVGAIVASTVASVMYTANNWGNWRLGEFLKVTHIAGLAGSAGGAAGGWAGGAVGGGFTGSIVGGAAGGAAGNATAYTAGAAVGDYKFEWGGFGKSIAIGAGVGAVSGAIGYGVDRAFNLSESSHYSSGFKDKQAAIAHRDMQLTRLSAESGWEYSSIVYEHQGAYYYSEPGTIYDSSVSPTVRELTQGSELTPIPDGSRLLDYGHTHPLANNPNVGGWHSIDYGAAVTTYSDVKAGGLEGFDIGEDYTETILTQKAPAQSVANLPVRAAPGTSWESHALGIGNMVKAGYGHDVQRGLWHLGSLRRIPLQYIREGVR